LKISATFVRSAAAPDDFPRDGAAQVALVGRSNVGKSSLINALVRRSVARTSGAPGKTRLANVYHVARQSAPPVYFVDLPGYGFARGGSAAFDEVVQAFFGQETRVAALLLVDARHPGLESDIAAWHWLRESVAGAAIAATKLDKLARGERIRAMRKLESVFEHPVVPVSALTGEGLDELWKVIDRLANNSSSSRLSSPPQPRPSRQRVGTARRLKS
jgi:GTP-binding protein